MLIQSVLKYFSFLFFFHYIKLLIGLERLNVKSISFDDAILIAGTEVKLILEISGAYKIRISGRDYAGSRSTFRLLVPDCETPLPVQLFGVFETRVYMLFVQPLQPPLFISSISNNRVKIDLPKIRQVLFDGLSVKSTLKSKSDIQVNYSRISDYKLNVPIIQFNHTTPNR